MGIPQLSEISGNSTNKPYLNMKYFAVVFAAIVALSVATPVEVEERQGDIINMIINMIKGFICDADLPIDNQMIQMIFNMVKGFLCKDQQKPSPTSIITE